MEQSAQLKRTPNLWTLNDLSELYALATVSKRKIGKLLADQKTKSTLKATLQRRI